MTPLHAFPQQIYSPHTHVFWARPPWCAVLASTLHVLHMQLLHCKGHDHLKVVQLFWHPPVGKWYFTVLCLMMWTSLSTLYLECTVEKEILPFLYIIVMMEPLFKWTVHMPMPKQAILPYHHLSRQLLFPTNHYLLPCLISIANNT